MSEAVAKLTTTFAVLLIAVSAGCREDLATAKRRFFMALEGADLQAPREMLAGRPDLAKASNESGVPALVLAVGRGNSELVEMLLKDGADPNSAGDGKTAPLQAALMQGSNPRETKLLLDAGADPNIADSMGITPLMRVSQFGDLPSVQVMAEKGADVNAVDTVLKRSVLHYAALSGNTEVVSYLLDHGANAKARDGDGSTPLQVAVASSRPPLSEEELRKKVVELASTNPAAAAHFAAQNAVHRVAYGSSQGKDFSGVIAALKQAGRGSRGGITAAAEKIRAGQCAGT